MMETEPGEVECAHEALNRSHRIVRPDIILDPRWKETGLLTALAGLECAIRHRPNRTSILENAEFLPSLDGQIGTSPVQPFAQKYSSSPLTQIKPITRPVLFHRGAARDRHERGTG